MRKNRGLRRLQTAAIRVEKAVAQLNAARAGLAADVATIHAFEQHRQREEDNRRYRTIRWALFSLVVVIVVLWLKVS